MKAIFSLLIFSILILQGCKSQAQDVPVIKNTPVKLIKVIQEGVSIPIRTSGILSAKDEIMLSFKTGGIIERFYVNEGQIVKKGQFLARLNLSEISAYRAQAEAGFKKAKRDLERIENLFDEKVATLEQKQNANSVFLVAQANLKIASFNEEHSKIIAPANGKVLKKFVDANELIGPGTPVLAFGSTEKAFILKAGITDKDVVLLQKGDKADIYFDAYPSRPFSASITQISGAATPGSGTYEIELQLSKSSKTLFSGFVGKVTIYPKRKQLLSTIPVNALNEADENSGYVYIINDQNLAEKIQVRIASILNDEVAFYNDQGIASVVNEGNAYLYENSPVEIIK